MQKLLLVTIPMILLAAAVYITHRLESGSPAAGPFVMRPFEDNGGNSSPIIVGDGSVNVRQKDNLIHEIDGNHAYVNLTAHSAASVVDGSCPAPVGMEHDTPWAACNALGGSSTLTAPWNIQLKDANGQVMGNIGAADSNFPSLIMFSTIDTAHTIVGREPDNGSPGDGEGFVECAQGASKCKAALASATITYGGSTVNYPLCGHVPNGKHCILRINYCDASTITGGNCK